MKSPAGKVEKVEKPRVHFVSLGESSTPEEMAAAAERLWEAMKLDRIIAKNALVAIKQHFGEKGARTSFRRRWPGRWASASGRPAASRSPRIPIPCTTA